MSSGIPDVVGLQSDEIRNQAGLVYMRRYYINGISERFHEILLSDDIDDLHDHPWHFTSRILHGSYIEHTPNGSIEYREGAVIDRCAEDAHRLELNETVWTYVKTGPFLRTWGFHTPNGWIDYRTYLGLEPLKRRASSSRRW